MRAITINKLSGICDKVKSIVTSRANGSEALTATPLTGESIFKHPTIVLTFVCIAIFHLQGCSEKIDTRQIQEVNGLIYKLNYADPFTGTVSNYKMPGFFVSPGTCELEVKDGKLDGTTICTLSNGVKFSETQYSDGLKNGLEQIWKSPQGILTSKKEWKNGKSDGLEETFDEMTGERTSLTNWSNNQKIGREQKWDPSGQTLLLSFDWTEGKNTGFSRINGEEKNFKNGKLDGFYRENANVYPGGKLERNYDNGTCVGSEKTWDHNNVLRQEREDCNFTDLVNLGWNRVWNEDGVLIEAWHYKLVNDRGIRDYRFRYDDQGKLMSEECHVDGITIYAGCSIPSFLSENKRDDSTKMDVASSSTTRIEQCVSGKIDAFRKEHGEDLLINADMLEEWKSECKGT